MPPDPDHIVTIRDVAAAAGVSPSAVSFAFNGRKGISSKRRAHVLKVAAKIGYRPDATMSKLMAHVSVRRKTTTHASLCLITGYHVARPWEINSSVRAFWEGAKARAAELGYGLDEIWYHEPGMTPERLRKILQARGVEGLLLSFAPLHADEMRLDFDFSGFAVGMSGICISEPELSFVMPDHFQNVLRALERAYALGYRRPLLALAGGASHRTHHLLEGGYLYFCSIHPDVTALPIHRQDDYEVDTMIAEVNRQAPDVVLSAQTGWERALGDRVPQEMGWISLGWMSEGGAGVAGIDRRLEVQAGVVVDIVVAQIHRRELGVPAVRRQILVPGVFVEGASLPPRAGLKPKKSVRRAKG